MNIHETLYNTYVNAQKDNASKAAIFTREGEIVTHGRLLEEIDKAATGLLSYKTAEDFKVGIISSSSYEEAVFLLAVNKIGAVSKFIDIMKNVTEIGESIAESSVNILVMGAEFLPMEQYINPSALPVIIMGKAELDRPNYCSYKDLLQKADVQLCQPVKYRDNACAIIIYSSGTTGAPKPIELSDRAINAAVDKIAKLDYPLGKGNIMLKIIPSFLGMGCITTLYTCLITGDLVVYPPFNHNPQEGLEGVLKAVTSFPSFVDKNHLSPDTKLLLFAMPMMYRGFYQCLERIEDMSFIGCMLAGGSAMSKEELEVIDAAFAAKGCTVPVCIGYGQNEMAGGVTMNETGANKRGSAGRPMAATTLKIVDMVTGVPVPNNTVGKILERSDSLFIGYENMPEQTKAAFVTDENGEVWFDTKDIGYIDDDGFLFFTGRTSRTIIRFDIKCSLDKIENKLRMSQYVKEAGVISLKGIPYNIPYAFVVLKDEYVGITPEMILDSVQSSRNPLNDTEMVEKLLIVGSLPYLSSGKIDYRTLEKMAEDTVAEHNM